MTSRRKRQPSYVKAVICALCILLSPIVVPALFIVLLGVFINKHHRQDQRGYHPRAMRRRAKYSRKQHYLTAPNPQSPNSEMEHNSNAAFFQLPLEIRQQIYGYFVPYNTHIQIIRTRSGIRWLERMHSGCRQVYMTANIGGSTISQSHCTNLMMTCRQM